MSNVTGPERAARWHAIDEKIMKEYAPWAPLLYPVRVDIVSERVKVPGWIFHPVRGEDLMVVEPAQYSGGTRVRAWRSWKSGICTPLFLPETVSCTP